LVFAGYHEIRLTLRNWSTERIRWMWGLGAFAEFLILLALFLTPQFEQGPRPPAPSDSSLSLFGSPSDSHRQKLHEYLRDSLGIVVGVSGDTLTSFAKDSFGLTVLTHGDTVRDLDLTPATERQVAAVVTPLLGGVAQAMDGIRYVILTVLAIILLPIPLALITVTLLWRRARRLSPPDAAA
jgi:hypothetical protein